MVCQFICIIDGAQLLILNQSQLTYKNNCLLKQVQRQPNICQSALAKLQRQNMDLIKLQYSEPSEIVKLDSHTFSLFIQEKLYTANPQFAKSQQCLNRLIDFINGMDTSIKNLKITKHLISAFQSPILYFLKDFYDKGHPVFTFVFAKQDTDDESTTRKKGKFMVLLTSISSMYKSLINGVGQIPEFSFLTRYGDSKKQISLVKSETEFNYLRFLKKCFEQETKMKDPNIKPGVKLNILSVLEDEINHIFKDSSSWYLEKITFNKIILKFRSIIDTTKHADTTLLRNISASNAVRQKASKASSDQEGSEFIKNILPCCRTFFYQNQQINHAQSFTLEYKNYQSPYDNFCWRNLKKAICGFLNKDGGVILVGIMERQDKFKRVKGQYLSENQKEEVLKEYRNICGQISPDIISQSKYKVKFVPIKSGNKKYIPGKYIVRVEVSAGNQQSLYTYRENKDQYEAIRTANEVLRRQINQDTLRRYKQKLLNPVKANSIHDKPCPDPEIGQPIWQNLSKKNRNQRNQEENEQDKFKKSKRQNWTQKMEQGGFSRKDRGPLNFVYFSDKPKQQLELRQQNYKKSKFTCDDDQDDSRNKQEEKQQQEEEYDGSRQNNDESLDFRPLNPIRKKKTQYIPKKVNKPLPLQPNTHIQEPNSIHLVSYKLEKAGEMKDSNQKPISQSRSLDILIVGYPYHVITKDIQNYQIDLVEPPIRCHNDLITWLKLSITNDKISIEYPLFLRYITRKHEEMNIDKKLRVRKVFQNLIFADQVFLNKLIHKYTHNQEFTDNDGCIFYKFKNNLEAVQAFVFGWEMNVKMKFIANKQLKQSKKEHLRQKVQSQF